MIERRHNAFTAKHLHDHRRVDLTGLRMGVSGALCWLPRVDQWAEVVAALLRPNGRLFLREGHPALFALADTRPDGLLPHHSSHQGTREAGMGAGLYGLDRWAPRNRCARALTASRTIDARTIPSSVFAYSAITDAWSRPFTMRRLLR